MPDCLYDTEVTIAVESSACFCIGGVVFVTNAGYFRVIGKPDATHLTLENMCLAGNASATTIIPSDQQVCTAGEPGADGADGTNGADGTDGQNICTVTTANFTQPAELATVAVEVADSSTAIIGEVMFVEDGGYYEVAGIPDGTHLTLQNLEDTGSGTYSGNAAPGATITSGAAVCPGGLQGPSGATGPTGPSGGIANSFKAVNSASQSQTDGGGGITVEFDTATYDPDGVWNTTTFTWTAPATGIFFFNLHLLYDLTFLAGASWFTLTLVKNGASTVATTFVEAGVNEGSATAELNTILSLAFGDTIEVNSTAVLNASTYNVLGTEEFSWISGFRLA